VITICTEYNNIYNTFLVYKLMHSLLVVRMCTITIYCIR